MFGLETVKIFTEKNNKHMTFFAGAKRKFITHEKIMWNM